MEAVMYKRFILLVGLFLGTHIPTAAQTPAPQIVPAREQVASITTTVRTVPAAVLAAPFLLFENPAQSAAHFSYLAGTYERDQTLQSLSPTREVKTLFLTQLSVPLVQFCGGRLGLDGFTSTLHMQNVQFGPSAAGGLDLRPPRQGYPGGPRSVGLYGISLSFHFGPDPGTRRPNQGWRCLPRIVGTVLN